MEAGTYPGWSLKDPAAAGPLPAPHLTARRRAVINTMKQKLERIGEEEKVVTCNSSQTNVSNCLGSHTQGTILASSPPWRSAICLRNPLAGAPSLLQEPRRCIWASRGLGFLWGARQGRSTRQEQEAGVVHTASVLGPSTELPSPRTQQAQSDRLCLPRAPSPFRSS